MRSAVRVQRAARKLGPEATYGTHARRAQAPPLADEGEDPGRYGTFLLAPYLASDCQSRIVVPIPGVGCTGLLELQ